MSGDAHIVAMAACTPVGFTAEGTAAECGKLGAASGGLACGSIWTGLRGAAILERGNA